MSGNASYASGLEVVVSSIEISEDAILLGYMSPSDVRDKGRVVIVHQIQIDRRHRQYRDGIDELVEAAEDLLKDVLGDWPHKEPAGPPEPVSEPGDDED